MNLDKPNGSYEAILVEIVKDLIQDWGLELENDINGNTTLVDELEFASVDIIQLCVAIEEHFDKKIGFQDLLMQNGSYVSDLSILQIDNYLQSKI